MSKKGIVLFGIDSSTTSTGVSVFINSKYIKSYLINLKDIKKSDNRICEMIKQIFKLIDEYHPEIICTEMTVVSRNVQAQRNLTMILGAIYGKCIEKDIYYYSFRPTEWRKLVGVQGRKREEYKASSIELVKKIYGIDIDSDDISDSILIGLAYANQFGG